MTTPQQFATVVTLLDDGNTVPFIARYRKEATGGLDEVAIAAIEKTHKDQLALDKRRETVLAAISEQGALTPDLERRIAEADKQTLEDVYLPFKKKRKTRASVARALGLEPLARRILAQPRDGSPAADARRFTGPDAPDTDAALAGARDIVAEVMSETPEIRAMAREQTARNGHLVSRAVKSATEGKRTAYEAWYDHAERLAAMPSHRYLAVRRGENDGVLRVGVELDADRLLDRIEQAMRLRRGCPWDRQLGLAIEDGYRRLLGPSIENEVRASALERAEAEAVDVFAANLRDLLLSAPFGRRPVIGIDPGFRTGCKCAALTETGRFAAHTTIFPHTRSQGDDATLAAFVRQHGAHALAIGNGTAGRETLAFARAALDAAGLDDVLTISVSESGASIYSASAIARDEFPDLDLTVRGAISIGRRLQDPLAELVKCDPQALGVGQYQHDITPSLLKERLARVVEICVNRVGVDLNTASAALLEHVAGIGPVTAKRIVERRDSVGPYHSRRDLLEVKGLGPKAFEQAAGFLRIPGAANPLDDSAVHPERYTLVARLAGDLGTPLERLVGNADLAGRIDIRRYVGGDVGEPTLRDIVAELGKPGRDPREVFEPPRFREGINSVDDLEEGMVLEGVVTNVAAFGAFVDIGVHQDGLVHVSKLADTFVKDPHAVVSVGQRLRVRIMTIDRERQRISLSVRDA